VPLKLIIAADDAGMIIIHPSHGPTRMMIHDHYESESGCSGRMIGLRVPSHWHSSGWARAAGVTAP
jgi:hypothetical protein